MENLTLHIEYLLLRHDCVVVPGIGAFINVRHAAAFDPQAGVWLPPTREVRFNGVLTHDDGLLANSYARKHGVTFQEGRELLRLDITQLDESLTNDGEATIGQLGILTRRDSTLCFTPRLSADRLSARMGFTAAPVSRHEEKADETVRAACASAATAQTAAEAAGLIPAAADIADERKADKGRSRSRKFNTRRNYYIAVNKVFARVSAAVMVAAAVTLSAMLPVSDCKREDQAAVVPVEHIIRSASERVAPAPEVAPAPMPAPEATPQAEPQPRFHAVVATFRTPEEAELFVSQNSGSGYSLQVVSSRTRSRVSAMSSDSRDDLQHRISTPEFRSRFSQAWIWEAE